MVQVINQDRLHSSAYRTEVSSRQGASSAREALPSPMTGSVEKREIVSWRQEPVVVPWALSLFCLHLPY